jgi:hypothetical protein
MMRGLPAAAVVAVATLPALGLAIGTSVAAPSGRPGRVVRVEREAFHNPRFCSAQSGDHGLSQVLCFGPAIAIGDRIVAVSAQHHGVMLGITSIEPYPNMCQPYFIWTVHVDLLVDTGGVVASGGSEMFVGLIDGGMDPRRSILNTTIPSVSRRSDSAGALGIDVDGNGTNDIAFEQHYCDDTGAPTPSGPFLCYELWVATTPDRWQRKRVDILHQNC